MGAVGYALVVRPLQIHNQKQNFDKAEASLDALAIQIQDKIGKADETKKEKTCGYSSQEFGRGPLGCGVQVGTVYAVSDVKEANVLNSEIRKFLLSSPSLSVTYDSEKTFLEPKNENQVQRNGYDIKFTDVSLGCSIGLVFANNISPDLLLKSQLQQKNLSIELSCGGPALKEFYPLKD